MYTQSNDVFAVHRRENELRGLIMARNRFATHLHRRQTFSPTVAGDDAAPSSSRCEVRRSPSPAMSDDEAALWDSMRSAPGPAVGSHEPSSSAMPGGDDLLPEPIDEVRACRRCYVGDACRIFRRVRRIPTSVLEWTFC